MTSPAADLAAQLLAALPEYRVIGYVSALDAVPKPTVIVWAETLTRTPVLGHEHVQVDLRVQVVVGEEDPEAADGRLWEATSLVLAALAPIGWVDWTTTERGVRNDNFHAYTITLTALATIGA